MLTVIDPRWEAFLKVAQLGSLTRAATALDCMQSVLSRQIALLETQCGERLFRRTGRGVVLTDFGEQVYARMRPLLEQARQVEDDIRTLGGEAIGEVRVGLLPSTVKTFAGRLFRAVRSRHPKVVLHFTDGASAHLEEWVNEGRLDLSLLLREDMVERPDQPTLAHIDLVLIGPPGDPRMEAQAVRFAELRDLPLIVPAHPHLLRERLDWVAREQGVTLTIAHGSRFGPAAAGARGRRRRLLHRRPEHRAGRRAGRADRRPARSSSPPWPAASSWARRRAGPPPAPRARWRA